MRLTLKEQYAILGVFDIAYNGDGNLVQVRVIGERQGIPPRYLEQIFQRLRRARLVEGKRGPGGGYRLARSPREITLRDVVEAVEGPLVRGLAPGVPAATLPHRPSFLWRNLAERLGEVLAETTLEALCRQAARRAVDRADPGAHMYHI